MTREDVPGAYRGRIPAGIIDGTLETNCGINLSPENSQIMLCGNPDMVTETVEALEKRGFKKNLPRTPGQVTAEYYW